MKKALITGITGQDGSYLAELLISKNYEVHGIVRRSSVSNTERIDYLIAENAVILHDGDLVRDRAVDAAHLECFQAVDGVFQLILIHVQRQKVPAFQTHCRKRGVLNDHAGVLRDRLAEDADKVVKIILFFHARAPFCCVIRFRMT